MHNRLVVICIVMLLAASSQVYAMSNADKAKEKSWVPELSEQRVDIEKSKSTITDVISKEPFIDIQQEKKWNFEKDEEKDIETDMAWLSALVKFTAMIIEAALWLIPLIIIFYIYRYREYWLSILQGRGPVKKQTDLPSTLFGLDIRKESLPDNIEKAAQDLWVKNEYREAISLLYRGSLVSLFSKHQFELASGATEQDCIHQIELSEQRTRTELSDEDSAAINQQIIYFKSLTQLWINIAYAHRLPDEDVFLQICHEWNRQFSDEREQG